MLIVSFFTKRLFYYLRIYYFTIRVIWVILGLKGLRRSVFKFGRIQTLKIDSYLVLVPVRVVYLIKKIICPQKNLER